ncbi:MAG: Ig-like domain-containing protein, partial [Nitrospirales bacterium]|nr:Ig-like domain-containing protein [Nitrospirales bacterium]
SLSGQVAVSATASDDTGVVGVQFRLNGTKLGSEDITSPYTIMWDTSGVPPGSYTLTAVARDAARNTTQSGPLTVNIPSPVVSTLSVSITGNGSVTSSPTGIQCSSGTCSTSYSGGGSVTLTAKADKRWNFAGWSGACSGTGECVVQVSTDRMVGAIFSQNGKNSRVGGKGAERKK